MFHLDHRTHSRLEISSHTNQAEADPGPFHRQLTETIRRQEGPTISAETERSHRKRAAGEENIPSTKRWSIPSHSYLSAQVLVFRLDRDFRDVLQDFITLCTDM